MQGASERPIQLTFAVSGNVAMRYAIALVISSTVSRTLAVVESDA